MIMNLSPMASGHRCTMPPASNHFEACRSSSSSSKAAQQSSHLARPNAARRDCYASSCPLDNALQSLFMF